MTRIKKDTSEKVSMENKLTIILSENESKVKIITPLKDLVQAYIEAGDKIKAFEDQIEPLKGAKEAIKQEIIKTFKERGEFSTRIKGATASLSVRKTAVVVDELATIAHLRKLGLDTYITEALSSEFDGVKKQIGLGELKPFEGVVIKETEFISVRSNDKKDARKLTTEPFKKIGGKHG